MATAKRRIVYSPSIVGFSRIRLLTVLLAGAASFGTTHAGAARVAQAGNSASAAPSIGVAKIRPSLAPAVVTGGIAFPTEVTVSGRNFRPGATVNIGSHAAGVISISATEIRATAPGGPAGSVDVTVTNPDGMSATLSKGFTYTTGPVVYGISPQTGSSTQPTVIDINGGNFASDSSVTVGGKTAPVRYFFSRASLEAEAPANLAVAPGSKVPAAVTVTNSDGQSFTLPGAFTWTREPSAIPSEAGSNNGPSAGPPRPGS